MAKISRPRRAERVLARVLVGMFVFGLLWCLRPFLWATDRERSIRDILRFLSIRQPEALALAVEHCRKYPDDAFGLALAAEAATIQFKNALAIEFLARLPQDHGLWEFYSKLGRARRCEVLGQIASAEEYLRQALKLAPFDLEANERLGHLLQVQGRSWEGSEHFLRKILRGRSHIDELLGVAAAERFFREDQRLELAIQDSESQDELMKLAAARRAVFQNTPILAERLLRGLVTSRPESGEAQGRLGRLIVERESLHEFLDWKARLSKNTSEHPEVWFVCGLKARQVGQLEGSVRCFWETLKRSPNHLAASLQISVCLRQLGHVEAAKEFSRRAEILSEIETALNSIRSTVSRGHIETAIAQFGAIGRYWEAAGWSYVLTVMKPVSREYRRQLSHWLPLALREPHLNASAMLPSRLFNGERFPEPSWPSSWPSREVHRSPKVAMTNWNFADDARRLGIQFDYYEGSTEETRLQHIINVMGGGLAAIDYDGDDWPDLYFAQANDWRSPGLQPQHRDRLFRNLGGDRFADVTELSRIEEFGFSHGISVGDFDQDGFSDLYVGNKGPNCLFRNNGDGTFEELGDRAGVAGNEWSTSSAFADLNGDCLPDLVVLNYTELRATEQTQCRQIVGEKVSARACTPNELPAEFDRVYLNLGDGTFRDVSEEAGILIPHGRGLGIVVWDFNADGRLDIFVANDTTHNFLFINQGPDKSGSPRFLEEAIVRGVAFDDEGRAQASMGVGAGDANGDGRIDLFITTFFAESNTLQCQRSDGFFENLTRSMQLRDPGFWMLGFGCQFADLDLDGWEDLVVTNGHVDQKSFRGDPDRMPPQVFQNERGRFAEVPAPKLGSFFEQGYLGRGLAVLDWNRDGLNDVAISHLHAPAALLTNRTQPKNQPLIVRLLGRAGCREPIGATVRLIGATGRQTRFLTAGNGFLVSNERHLNFAIANEDFPAELEIQWPCGERQTYNSVTSSGELTFREGQPAPVRQRSIGGEAPTSLTRKTL